MFGGEISNNRGLLIGAAIGMGQRLREEEAAHDLETARLHAVIEQLQDQLEITQRELASERCEVAGLRGFIKTVQQLDPQTPGLAASGSYYKSGNQKVVATLAYERAYDQKALDLGHADLRGTYAR